MGTNSLRRWDDALELLRTDCQGWSPKAKPGPLGAGLGWSLTGGDGLALEEVERLVLLAQHVLAGDAEPLIQPILRQAARAKSNCE